MKVSSLLQSPSVTIWDQRVAKYHSMVAFSPTLLLVQASNLGAVAAGMFSATLPKTPSLAGRLNRREQTVLREAVEAPSRDADFLPKLWSIAK